MDLIVKILLIAGYMSIGLGILAGFAWAIYLEIKGNAGSHKRRKNYD